ncbi:hypothetical protein ACFFQW_03010 [Umezawaea endophytica]|uniref:DUF2721 domain-containing protein n=1 Tax=Umezawaea endophytica TaxID=1654476 RepID=A0A9X3AG41_9PSEU|nr:hypothetical protein [Umezawaea endophytica]MCS7479116.1 hypothetical protein [Umezawaea endophytica]
MSIADALAICGTDVSATSVIIVYHMFAMQSWFTRVENARIESIRLSLMTSPDDIERESMRLQIIDLNKAFPWVQVAILGVAVVSMAAVGTTVVLMTKGLPVPLVLFPLGGLVVIYAVSSVVTYFKGVRAIAESRTYLA